MNISLLINGIRDMLKEIIVIKNGVYKLFQIPSWKAFCQDTIYISSYNKDNIKIQNTGAVCEKGGKRGRKGRKEHKKQKFFSFFRSTL